jgi:hypothetical protein
MRTDRQTDRQSGGLKDGRTDGETDVTNPTATFRNFVNAPNKSSKEICTFHWQRHDCPETRGSQNVRF